MLLYINNLGIYILLFTENVHEMVSLFIILACSHYTVNEHPLVRRDTSYGMNSVSSRHQLILRMFKVFATEKVERMCVFSRIHTNVEKGTWRKMR